MKKVELEVDEKQAEILVEMLESKNRELVNEIKTLQEHYTSNINLINQLRKVIHDSKDRTTLPLFDVLKDYNNNWTWKEKILHILKIKRGFLTVRDILNIIYRHEPVLEKEDRKNRMNISSILVNLFKEKLVEREKDEASNEYQYTVKDG